MNPHDEGDYDRVAEFVRTHTIPELASAILASGLEDSYPEAEQRARQMRAMEHAGRWRRRLRRYLLAGAAFLLLIGCISLVAVIVGGDDDTPAVTVPSGLQCLLAGNRHLGFEAGVAQWAREQGLGGARQTLIGARVGVPVGNGWREYEAAYEFTANGRAVQFLFGGRLHTSSCDFELY